MKKHWITLFPYTFLWIKNNTGFIYNSKDFKNFKFRLNEEIARICHELVLPSNLYSTQLTTKDLENSNVSKWISLIVNKFNAGYLSTDSHKRPISFKPGLKLLEDKNYHMWEHLRGFGGNIMLNIHELTFYINSSSTGNDEYFKQVFFPLKNCLQIDVKNIISFIRQSQNPFLLNINIVGNIFSYTYFEQLINEITRLEYDFTIIITNDDLYRHYKRFKKTKWPSNVKFNVIIDSVPNYSLMPFENSNTNIFATTLVYSKQDYDLYFKHFEHLPIYSDAKVVPVFNDNNLKFFSNYVFITEDDLDETTLTKRDIFMRQVINTNDFGNLTIFPDGHVYANINLHPLGRFDDSVYSLIYHNCPVFFNIFPFLFL